jgi:hypothetical protein
VEVPPAVVVDAHDVCSNLEQAQDSLKAALGSSVAPESGWRLRVFDERQGTHIVVTANLDDAQGNAIAHRVIETTTSDRCDGVVSALGIWAGLVLDAEVAKAKAHPKDPKLVASNASTVAAQASANTNGGRSNATSDASAPVVPEISPDATLPQQHKRTIEIGASGTLSNSPLTLYDAALVGGDVFTLVEVVHSFFLRPSLGGAASIGGGTAGYFNVRMDACLRVPGNYVEHRGLLLDMCAGTELGGLYHQSVSDGGIPGAATVDAMFAISPTIGLRGDVASDLSVEVRGLANFNIVHTGDTTSLLTVRAEVGLTWRVR